MMLLETQTTPTMVTYSFISEGEDIHVPLSMNLEVGDESIGIIGQWDHLSRPI